MALTTLGFLGMASFPGWHTDRDARTGEEIDVKPFPSRRVLKGIVLALGAASLLLMISALWQHVAAASAVAIITSTVRGNNVVGDVGAASTGLVWLSFALTVIAFQGALIFIISLQALDRLTDE